MQSLRFTHIVCTSMKRGLAMVKAWIMKRDVLCWSSFDTAYHKQKSVWQLPEMKYAKSQLYAHFIKFEHAPIPSVNLVI